RRGFLRKEEAMRWEDFRRSDNIDDRRGDRGGGGGGIPGGRGGLGIGTIVVLGLVGWALGIDPRLLIGGAEILTGGGPSTPASPSGPRETGTPADQTGPIVSAVLGETEDRGSELPQAQYRAA